MNAVGPVAGNTDALRDRGDLTNDSLGQSGSGECRHPRLDAAGEPVVGDEHLLDACPHEEPVANDRPSGHDRVPGGHGATAQPGLDRIGDGAGDDDPQRPHGDVADRSDRERPDLADPTQATGTTDRRHLQRHAGVPSSAPSRSFASSIAWPTSSHSEVRAADDEPSTPRPTCTPARRSATDGATPDERIMLVEGQCAVPIPAAPSRRNPCRDGITEAYRMCGQCTIGGCLRDSSGWALERGQAELVCPGVVGEVRAEAKVESLGEFWSYAPSDPR